MVPTATCLGCSHWPSSSNAAPSEGHVSGSVPLSPVLLIIILSDSASTGCLHHTCLLFSRPLSPMPFPPPPPCSVLCSGGVEGSKFMASPSNSLSPDHHLGSFQLSYLAALLCKASSDPSVFPIHCSRHLIRTAQCLSQLPPALSPPCKTLTV